MSWIFLILFKIGPAQDARLNVIRGLRGSDRNRRSHKKSDGCHNDYEDGESQLEQQKAETVCCQL